MGYLDDDGSITQEVPEFSTVHDTFDAATGDLLARSVAVSDGVEVTVETWKADE
jgi:hypothetical protein